MAQGHSSRQPACMVLDESGKVRWWGHDAVNLLQVPSSEAVGRWWWDLMPEPWRAAAQQAWQEALAQGGKNAPFQSPAALSGESWIFHFEPIPVPHANGTLWHGTLTPAKPNERPLADAVYEAAFETTQDALLVAREGRIVALNIAAEDFFGVTREQAHGQPLSALGIAVDLAGLAQDTTGHQNCGSWWLKVQRRGKDQEPLAVETQVIRLSLGTGPAWLLCFRQPGQQLALRKGLLRAQQTQSLGPVINGIIHDFNNYFTAILSNLDLAETSPHTPPDCLNFIRNARLASQNGAEVIRHLQLFTRRGADHPEPLDPRVLLEEIVTLMQHCLGRAVRVAKLHVNAVPGLVLGRPALLRQLLINVCLNAREAMSCGGELAFHLDKAEFAPHQAIAPRRAGLFARITVADTGHGMPPEIVARLQHPFFTTHADRELGLGLFAANEILTAHGGWMEVESQKAKGTRVHLYLPARPPTTHPEPLAQDALLLQQKKLEGTERLLVVEPDQGIRVLLKAVLGYRGYEVLVAENGEEALKMAAAAASPVQALLADLNLPDMTAWQLMYRLRHQWPEMKVILLLQELSPELLSLAQRARASLLTKPVENQRLLLLLRECLDVAVADRPPSAS